ncbi:MAG TPA: hypothetical protein DDZ81_10490 [Acetobacteraceae bacterium]|jgi:hypothetical protein|nr:hypothetical protein [Acetobacteraceae bacterium]
MRIGLVPVLGLVLIVAGCNYPPIAEQVSPQPATTIAGEAVSEADIAAETAQLRTVLIQEVPEHTPRTVEADRAWLARTRSAIGKARLTVLNPQLLVVVDRNPTVQQAAIVLARPDGQWEVIGGSKVSTGQAGRRGYFITPTGVFRHSSAILDYRALGTFNENHIRGLGLKGMRVWDFGWQIGQKGWLPEYELGEMRLQMHATDPEYLEQRLGRPASEGCIRIPASMNRFLDVHGILDADYEQASRSDDRFSALLLPDRTPAKLAGDALVVIDSSDDR